jgi:hypothetical protein
MDIALNLKGRIENVGKVLVRPLLRRLTLTQTKDIIDFIFVNMSINSTPTAMIFIKG